MNNFFTKISNNFANRLYLWTFSLVALHICCNFFLPICGQKNKKAVVRNFDLSGALILLYAKLCLCFVLAVRDAFLATFQP